MLVVEKSAEVQNGIAAKQKLELVGSYRGRGGCEVANYVERLGKVLANDAGRGCACEENLVSMNYVFLTVVRMIQGIHLLDGSPIVEDFRTEVCQGDIVGREILHENHTERVVI